MRISCRWFLGAFTLLFLAPEPAVSAPGDLDPTFGVGGTVRMAPGAGETWGRGIALQPDGKVVIAGSQNGVLQHTLLLVRYGVEGSLDSTFGLGGVVSLGRAIRDWFRGNAVAVQPDGKIVVAGSVDVFSFDSDEGNDVLVARLHADGSVDAVFSNSAALSGGCQDVAHAVAVQPDGKIVVVGASRCVETDDVLVLRYEADGDPDGTFGAEGVVRFNGRADGDDSGSGVAIQPDGKIVVVGSSSNGSNADVLILRYRTDGSLDRTFGVRGAVTFNGSAEGNDSGAGVALQPNGRIVVAGSVWTGSRDAALVLRYRADGSRDVTFGSDGAVRIGGPAKVGAYASDVAVQRDGKILIAGTSRGLAAPAGDILAVRLRADGTFDGTFGSGGVVTYQGPADDQGWSSRIAVQPDGKILVAGASRDGLYSDLFALRLIGRSHPRVRLISPDGSETIPSGSVHPIWWVAPAAGVSFTFTYSLNGGLTWANLAAGATGLPPFLWTVPAPPNNRSNCLVKAVAYDAAGARIGADRSDRPFAIEVVKLTSPNGGETLPSGSSHTITWVTNATRAPVSLVQLRYSLDGGSTWRRIDTSADPSDDGSFAWTVPTVRAVRDRARVKVVLRDAAGRTVGRDSSDRPFAVRP